MCTNGEWLYTFEVYFSLFEGARRADVSNSCVGTNSGHANVMRKKAIASQTALSGDSYYFVPQSTFIANRYFQSRFAYHRGKSTSYRARLHSFGAPWSISRLNYRGSFLNTSFEDIVRIDACISIYLARICDSVCVPADNTKHTFAWGSRILSRAAMYPSIPSRRYITVFLHISVTKRQAVRRVTGVRNFLRFHGERFLGRCSLM